MVRVVGGSTITSFVTVMTSAGVSTERTVAGVRRTVFSTVAYSGGTSTRHMISPVEASIFSIGPRPSFHVV